MNKPIVVISAMRLAFEEAISNTRPTRRGRVYRTVKSALRGRRGVTYRKRLWSVERAKRR